MDIEHYEAEQARKKKMGDPLDFGLFAPPTKVKATAATVETRRQGNPKPLSDHAQQIAAAIREKGTYGATRKEVAEVTGIPKDTVNRRCGHDLKVGKPGSLFVEPFVRNGEKVMVWAAVWDR